MKDRFRLVLGLTLLLAACGGSQPAAPQAASGASAGTSDATLTAAIGVTPNTLDPVSTNGPNLNPMTVNVLQPPFQISADGALAPNVALTYKTSTDGLTATITLRKGVTFHDGTPVDAKALEENIIRQREPATKSQQAVYYTSIKDMKVVDPLTLELHLSQPSPMLPEAMTLPGSALISPASITANGNSNTAYLHPVGTGPYRLQEHVAGDHTTMVRYDGYWGSKPYYKTLIYRYVPEANTRESLLLAKQIDVVIQPPIADIDSLKANKNVKMSLTPGNLATIVSIDTQWPGLTDPRVRQALNYAVDKKAGIQSVLHGAARELQAPTTLSQFGACQAGSYAYDPAKAKALLQEAGATHLKLPFVSPTGRYPQDFEAAQVVANYLRAVGVDTSVDTMAWPSLISQIVVPAAEQKFPLQFLGYGGTGPDASLTLEQFTKAYWPPKGVAINFFTSPETEKLFSEQATNNDPASRKDQICQLSKAVWDAAPWIFLWAPDVTIAYRSNLTGLDFLKGNTDQFVLTGMKPA